MFKNIKAVMIDLSGTLHIENQAVEGAKAALDKLRASGLPLLFVTNTTKETRSNLKAQLDTCGLEVKESEIYTSLMAAGKAIQRRNFRPLLLVDDEAIPDLGEINTNEPDGVVIGWSPRKFTYENMNHAFRILMDGGPFIAIHKARYVRRADSKLHLGPGPFVTGLEFASRRSAEVIGKPAKNFYSGAAEILKVSLDEAVMIGDDLDADVVGAEDAGMKAILVRTGKYQTGDEHRYSDRRITSCGNVLEAVERILKDRN